MNSTTHRKTVEQNLEDTLTVIEARVDALLPLTKAQGYNLFEAYQEQTKQLKEVEGFLNIAYSEPCDTRAIKALIEEMYHLESDRLSSVDDFGGAGFASEQAEKIVKFLKSFYDVEIDEDSEDSEIIHVIRDGKPFLVLNEAGWIWELPVAIKQEKMDMIVRNMGL